MVSLKLAIDSTSLILKLSQQLDKFIMILFDYLVVVTKEYSSTKYYYLFMHTLLIKLCINYPSACRRIHTIYYGVYSKHSGSLLYSSPTDCTIRVFILLNPSTSLGV